MGRQIAGCGMAILNVLRKNMKSMRNKILLLLIAALILSIAGCKGPANPTATTLSSSVSGYNMGISAIYGESSLLADGSSQATIRVEVWGSNGQFADNVTVTLTTSMGTLASSSLTTISGVAVTTFTAGTVPGNAAVTATVQNISATATISLRRF